MSTPIELNDIPADTHDTIDTGTHMLAGIDTGTGILQSIEAIDDVACENIIGRRVVYF